jgi:hypothetical protein
MIRAGYEARTSGRTHWQFLAVHAPARLTFNNRALIMHERTIAALHIDLYA